MNYRDFFKNKKATRKDILALIPEGVDPKEFQMGVKDEMEHTDDEFVSAQIAGKHLRGDKHYYSKLKNAGLEEGDVEECGTCGCGDPDDDHSHDDGYDDNGGLPKVGGALAVPHLGQPIMMGKIIQVGGLGGRPASGELSGMTNAGVKDKGVPATQPGDKEPLTAGGKAVGSSIASKSVGGNVVPGEGQEQGGPDMKGTISGTSKLNESKNKVRKIVKEVLKEIRFDKQSGKWVRIDEAGHKAGCSCGFCKNKGTFGKKKTDKKDDKKADKKEKEDVDETVNMKMGKSYKTVQPRMYDIQSDDRARTNQYDPEITEMYDDEEECMMNERYVELANANRNLNEAELSELKTLREKIDHLSVTRNQSIGEGRCEDFPCCGHESGDCPDRDEQGNETWRCAKCRATLPKGARSSLCNSCLQDISSGDADDWEDDRGGDHGFEENVNMKMGPSHKTVQPRLYKTSDDDFARTNQYDPQVSEHSGTPSHGIVDEPETLHTGPNVNTSRKDVELGHPGQPGGFHNWKCDSCGHTITSKGGNAPQPIRWKDGHVCHFDSDAEKDIAEAGSGAVQHSSYRTQGRPDHGNLPQDPKTRWANDLDEASKKPSKVAKTITKGQKAKTTKKNPFLKFQKAKKTTSGVHKRKT